MNKKFITAVTSIAVPLVFILGLYTLNPIIGFIKLNIEHSKLTLAIIGVILAILVNYVFYNSTKQNLIPNKTTLKKTSAGLVIGVSITLILLGILLPFSELKVELNTQKNYLEALMWCLIFFPLAYMEEIIFRGTAFIKLKNTVGIRSAQLIFALLFAFYHDPTGSTFGTQLLGPGFWALIYGWAAIKSGGIAFPTGIHAGVNIVQALFGMKENVFSIWNFYYDDNITQELQNKTEFIGLIIQLCILAFGIVLTEQIHKQNKQKA